jgi:hypothetical protein
MIKLIMECVVRDEAHADEIAVKVCETFKIGVSVQTVEVKAEEDDEA